MSASLLIVIDRLTKHYPGMPTPALQDLSLSVASGEVYGFLGANGAGKSTTIRTLLNFLEPTSGSATIAGYDIVRDTVMVKKHIGYLAGEVELYGKATGKQFLHFMAALQPLKHTAFLDELVKRFEVTLDQPIATLSKGNRQKLGIVQAFMHEPEALILDEPTSGLDPLMQEVFFKLVEQSKSRGAAIFLSSHNLNETQRMCDRVGIIKHGQLIREESINELSNLDVPTLRIGLAHAGDIAKLKHLKQLTVVSSPDAQTAIVQPASSIAEALRALSTFDIRSLTTEQSGLEDDFVKFYEDEK